MMIHHQALMTLHRAWSRQSLTGDGPEWTMEPIIGNLGLREYGEAQYAVEHR